MRGERLSCASRLVENSGYDFLSLTKRTCPGCDRPCTVIAFKVNRFAFGWQGALGAAYGPPRWSFVGTMGH